MTPRQNRFVHEYLKDLNGTQAAIRSGCPKASADVTAARWLAKVSVRREVDAAIARRELRTEVKVDDVLRELALLASFDIGKAYDKRGAFLPLHEMPEDVRRAINSIEAVEQTDSEGNVTGILKKIKFVDKKGPLELLGKHLGMFIEKHEHEAGKELMAMLAGVPKDRAAKLATEIGAMTPDQQTEVARGKG